MKCVRCGRRIPSGDRCDSCQKRTFEVLAASADLWDVATGRKRGTVHLHPSDVRAVAFSPDGRMLATCSGHRTVVQKVEG